MCLPLPGRRFHLVSLLTVLALSSIMIVPIVTAQTSTCFPNMGRIAFISNRSGSEQIYLMDADGSHVDRVTDLDNADLSDLDWSPDGKRIVFVNYTGATRSDIYLLDIESLRIVQVTGNPGPDYSPAWSPDGKYIAYTTTRGGPYDIWIMKSNGANIRPMTYDPRWEITVEWIPDGSGIAYVPNSGANLEIWLEAWTPSFNRDTLLFKNIDYSQAVLHFVSGLDWSPDGERLALDTSYGTYVINVDGTGLTQIEPRETYASGSAPSWASDSRHIVFASNRDENAEIYTLDLDTYESQRLMDNSSYDVYPAWQPVLAEDCSDNVTPDQ